MLARFYNMIGGLAKIRLDSPVCLFCNEARDRALDPPRSGVQSSCSQASFPLIGSYHPAVRFSKEFRDALS
jgi:hypothetical protein